MCNRWKIKVKMRQQLATTRSINIDQGSVSVAWIDLRVRLILRFSIRSRKLVHANVGE